MATPVRFRAEVTKIIRHSTDVATYEFRSLDKRPRYKAGQFLHLALDPYDPSGHWPESRVFTIAKGATDRDFIRLTIARKGNFTSRIFDDLQEGQIVWMKAPYGEFIVRTNSETETVLIAGGTGITPFVAFMEDALVRGIQGDVWLHYGAKAPQLLVFRNLADRCATELPRFRVRYYVETGQAAGCVQGTINLDKACASLRDTESSVFYLCGPPEMVDVITGRLSGDYNVPEENIKVDQWD